MHGDDLTITQINGAEVPGASPDDRCAMAVTE
jgi:hypothetical protein